MTTAQIRRYYREHLNDSDERLVDIDIYDCKADLITISKNHIVWKTTYIINDGRLEFHSTKLLA